MKRLILMLGCLLLLAGCTLARTEGQSKNDKLVGMLVSIGTLEDGVPRDFWDVAGMEPIQTFQSQGVRLYAERYEQDGVTHYRFPEGAGLACFGYAVYPEGEDPRMEYVTAPELRDVHRTTHIGGDGAGDHTEVTLYASEDAQTMAYMNPVFQTADGEVYALGICAMGHQVARMHGSTSLDWNGGSIRMTGEPAAMPEQIRILQMDGEHRVLGAEVYSVDALPERVDPGGAAYLLLEEVLEDEVIRTVCGPEEKAIEVLVRGRYDLGSIQYIQILWEE